jgi:hypothetical protein
VDVPHRIVLALAAHHLAAHHLRVHNLVKNVLLAEVAQTALEQRVKFLKVVK